VGIIAAVEGKRISIEPEGADPVRIPFSDIKSARLEPQLPF
jgi:ribosome maturation factor RimP